MTARRALAGVLLAGLSALPVAVAGDAPVRLRYGFEPGQRWTAEQIVVSDLRLGDQQRTERGSARFAYEVSATQDPEWLRLDARMLSQSVAGEPSPLDFGVIEFQASTNRRGRRRGAFFELADAAPPDLPGMPPDPDTYQQLLRRIADAWIEAIYWLPELPEEPLAVGESFTVGEREDVGGGDPGVRMELASRTTYTLREVADGVARFAVESRSAVDAATATEQIESHRVAEGEALFDLGIGMWVRHELRSEDVAQFIGSRRAGDAYARSTTTIAMQRVSP